MSFGLGMLEFTARTGLNFLGQGLSYRLDRNLCKPSQVVISLTAACAARCIMCDIWKLKPLNELSIDEWKHSFSQMREWLGPHFVFISGGEPFQKKDLFKLLAHAREIGVKTAVTSNGMLLKERFCDHIVEYGPDFLSLSVDSHRADVHDFIRGRPGLHARCTRVLQYLREKDAKIILGIAVVIMEQNYRELPQLVRWALDLEVDRVLFQPLYPTFVSDEDKDRHWFEKNPQWVKDADRAAQVIDELQAMKRTGAPIWNPHYHLEAMKAYFRDPYHHPRPPECMVRYNTFNVAYDGDVNFCYTVANVVGNIRQQNPQDIWNSHQAAQVRGLMKGCKAPCMLNCYRPRSLGDLATMFNTVMQHDVF